jgi:GAF domain-containing protein
MIGNESERADAIVDAAARQLREMIDRGAPLRQILARLTSAAEEISGTDAAASILLVDHEGLLRNGASPNLPADYLDAIDRIKPNPDLGTCAAAAATGQIVITRDFREDEKWTELKHLPLSIGYRSAWSVPIKGASSRVLGTFGTYFAEAREPNADEMRTTPKLASLAAKAIEANLLSQKG